MRQYKKYEMESAMTKMIRQCNEDALYWAYNLSQATKGCDRIWERLRIMSAEDIGIAFPWLRSYLDIQYQLFLSLSDKKSQLLILLNAVCFFTRQNKSRLCDNITHAYFKDFLPKIPATNLDQMWDLLKNSIVSRDLDMVLKCVANLYHHCQDNKIIELFRFPEDPESRAIIKHFEKYNQAKRCGLGVLFLINVILYRIMDFSKLNITFEIEELNMKAVVNDTRELEVPDCAYDYHCTIGRNMGRGYRHYYDEGAKLNQCCIEDPYEILARKNNIPKDTEPSH